MWYSLGLEGKPAAHGAEPAEDTGGAVYHPYHPRGNDAGGGWQGGRSSSSCQGPGVYQLLTAVYAGRETDQESELENEALSMTIVKKAPEGIAAGLITPVLCLNGQILLLTGANAQEELREKTMRIHTEFTEFVETEFGCSLISGVSQVFPGLKYLRTAYNECMETLKESRGERAKGSTAISPL